MRIIYNGVDLFAVDTHEFTAEPVYDDTGTDYLYTRYSIVVTAMVNGQLRTPSPTLNNLSMSYDFVGPEAGATPPVTRPPSPFVGALVPGAADGIDVAPTSAPRGITFVAVGTPLTHAAVRHRLTTPRAPLYVFSGPGMESGNPPVGGFGAPQAPAQLFLTSPAAPYEVDAKNGPFPKLLGVTSAVGDAQTLMVEFAVETYVNEAKENNARPYSSLLSNRWKQSHAFGKDGYVTIVTEGTAIFRTDVVYNEDTSPDVARQIIFMPVPYGFVREVDDVSTREDVTGIYYRYRDTQQSVNFVAGPFIGAAEITAVHRQAVTSDVNLLPAAVALAERAMNMLLNAKWLKAKAPPEGAAGPPRLPGRVMAPGRGPRPWKPEF